ncbi:hypothetical protein [Acinetobacter sp. YH1901136]|uniref:hypothetical protein n=1 Tax=Acinetobacter sp. YH1901136 TaxID=2601200 RepID=UPI0015D37713|nr:hypothetical protein [Acinetobacter sp. YH1901136]
MLEKQGIIKIKLVKPKNFNKKKPILRVQLNNKLNLIYDTLDGFNWKDDLNRSLA